MHRAMTSASPTLDTFDWSLTERRMVMLVPNFGRGHLFRAAFAHFWTRLPRSQYLVLVANDGIDEGFADLAELGVAFLTLHREPASPRNGAKVRNAVIKRCRSEWVFQRDPEILFGEDVLARCAERDGRAYRIGRVALLDRASTDVVRALAHEHGHDSSKVHPREESGNARREFGVRATPVAGIAPPTPLPLLNSLAWREIDSNASTFLHFGFGIKTSLLRSIRGYDEAFTHYGYEDVDLFERMRELGELPETDVEARAAHLWHEPLPVGTGSVKDDAAAMRRVYLDHKAMGPVRNPECWGEG